MAGAALYCDKKMNTLNIHHTLQCKDLQVTADRDDSHLRLNIMMPNGSLTSVDFYGAMITKLQTQINHAIQLVPGLAVWKGEDFVGPVATNSETN